jgi:Sap, sulfolipid-1-addressing protein
VFVVLVLAVVEIILVLNMAAPAKTQAALGLLHDWSGARRRQILVAISIVVGVTLAAQGMGCM